MTEVHTFYGQDKREYSVEAGAAGIVEIVDADHPAEVTVDEEFSWYVVGHVANAVVRNPAVAYYYKDGPAGSVKLVKQDGTEIDLPKGQVLILYVKGDVAACTNLDSRDVLRGAKFPVEGTYTIWLVSGYLSDDQAGMGVPTLGGMHRLVTSQIANFRGVPTMVTAEQQMTGLLLTMGALTPLLLAGGVIIGNELAKWK